jgi:hypothetical protein
VSRCDVAEAIEEGLGVAMVKPAWTPWKVGAEGK